MIREAVEAVAQSCRSVLDDVDADIGVEHVTQHQRRSRSSTIGCLRSAMKSSETRGPSKNASQDWSAGLIIRLRPILVISTWRTPAGKATGLGRRTAWLRLVVKTVERAIMTPIGIYQWDIRDPPVAVK